MVSHQQPLPEALLGKLVGQMYADPPLSPTKGRRYPRFRGGIAIKYQVMDDDGQPIGESIDATVKDISRSGIRIETAEEIKAPSITVTFRDNRLPARVVSVVRRETDGPNHVIAGTFMDH